jgi:ketosteroid isomerase-like protein
MSQKPADVVRASWEAFASGGIDGAEPYWHPDIDWRAIEGAPDDVGEFRGRDAMRRYYDEWGEMFDDIANTPEEFVEAGDDVVVAVQHASGRAKTTGLDIDMRYAVVYTVRDGQIVRGREYATRAEALAAAGVSD